MTWGWQHFGLYWLLTSAVLGLAGSLAYQWRENAIN